MSNRSVNSTAVDWLILVYMVICFGLIGNRFERLMERVDAICAQVECATPEQP